MTACDPQRVFGLSLVNCKNVVVSEVTPPERLSRKHARKRGEPLTSYYVLDIEPMRRILDSEGEAQTKGSATRSTSAEVTSRPAPRIHPLFGKRVGTYWWASQVRGKAEEGVVGRP